MTRKEPEPNDQALRPRAGGLVVINLADETAVSQRSSRCKLQLACFRPCESERANGSHL